MYNLNPQFNTILDCISSNSCVHMDLIPFMISLSMGLLSLLFLVTCLLNSAQHGGGCLFGITVTVNCCELLDLVVSTLGVSTFIRSSSQSDLKHQHLLYFLIHSEQNSPIKLGLVTSTSSLSVSVRGIVLANSGLVNISGGYVKPLPI